LAVVVLQVFILDALVNYQVQDSKDAEKIVERVLPRLQHVNSAVVLSAAKVCMVAAGNIRVKHACRVIVAQQHGQKGACKCASSSRAVGGVLRSMRWVRQWSMLTPGLSQGTVVACIYPPVLGTQAMLLQL
jgi:hypothetical protein